MMIEEILNSQDQRLASIDATLKSMLGLLQANAARSGASAPSPSSASPTPSPPAPPVQAQATVAPVAPATPPVAAPAGPMDSEGAKQVIGDMLKGSNVDGTVIAPLLQKYNASKISEMDPAHYPALIEEVRAKLAAPQ